MRDLAPAIRRGDLGEMAALVRSMKRLWEGRNLAGLLRRREAEAVLIEAADHPYEPDDFILV